MFVFRLVSYAVIAIFAAILGVKAMAITGMASAYPTALVLLVLAGTAIMTIQAVAKRKQAMALHGDVARLADSDRAQRAKLAGFVLLWVVYPWLLFQLGFIVATTVAIAFAFWLLDRGKILTGLITGAVFSVAFAVLFATVFYVPVPAGMIDTWLTELLFRLTS